MSNNESEYKINQFILYNRFIENKIEYLNGMGTQYLYPLNNPYVKNSLSYIEYKEIKATNFAVSYEEILDVMFDTKDFIQSILPSISPQISIF